MKRYFVEVAAHMLSVPFDQVAELVDILADAWENDRTVVLMGNGGSSSSTSHIVADLQKNIFLATGRALRTVSLTDSAPLVTAWGNDTQFTEIFAQQIRCWVKPGDVVIAVSGSGNSPNIIEGVKAANEMGALTLGLAGYQAGKLAHIAQRCIIAGGYNMQQIEDVHMSILHAAYLGLLNRLAVRSVNGNQAAADAASEI